MKGVHDWPAPQGGWPSWLWSVPYDGSCHPGAPDPALITSGANCQRYAFAVLERFGRTVPPFRSSELWEDRTVTTPVRGTPAPLDVVFFNSSPRPWGAHIALLMAEGQLLHLSREVGRPAVWTWEEFAVRER